MKILVTGITGRIGANLAMRLVAAGHQVRGLVWPQDRRTAKLAPLAVELVEGSLVNPHDVAAAVDGMEVIYHLGAAFQGGGPFSNEQYFEINVRGTFNMLEAAAGAAGLKRFFFASSDALYDKYTPEGLDAPIQEDTFPLAPRGAYSVTKHLGEDLCRGYARSFGLPVTVFRFALTMAGDEILKYRQFYAAHWRSAYVGAEAPAAGEVRAQLEAALIEQGEDCLIVARDVQGRSYKKHVADVRDIVAGLVAGLDVTLPPGEVIQLAGPEAFTWEAVVPYLAQKLGLPYVDVRLAGQTPTRYEFDLSKGRRLMGLEPGYDVFRMIDEAVTLDRGAVPDVLLP
jgi:UDP-glucose 4-epimerase